MTTCDKCEFCNQGMSYCEDAFKKVLCLDFMLKKEIINKIRKEEENV